MADTFLTLDFLLTLVYVVNVESVGFFLLYYWRRLARGRLPSRLEAPMILLFAVLVHEFFFLGYVLTGQAPIPILILIKSLITIAIIAWFLLIRKR